MQIIEFLTNLLSLTEFKANGHYKSIKKQISKNLKVNTNFIVNGFRHHPIFPARKKQPKHGYDQRHQYRSNRT